MFDDTWFAHAEMHNYFVTFYDHKKKTPVAKLISLKPTLGKDAATNAAEDMINYKATKIEMGRHGGTNSDHAAMAEGKQFGKLIIEA